MSKRSVFTTVTALPAGITRGRPKVISNRSDVILTAVRNRPRFPPRPRRHDRPQSPRHLSRPLQTPSIRALGRVLFYLVHTQGQDPIHPWQRQDGRRRNL